MYNNTKFVLLSIEITCQSYFFMINRKVFIYAIFQNNFKWFYWNNSKEGSVLM